MLKFYSFYFSFIIVIITIISISAYTHKYLQRVWAYCSYIKEKYLIWVKKNKLGDLSFHTQKQFSRLFFGQEVIVILTSKTELLKVSGGRKNKTS